MALGHTQIDRRRKPARCPRIDESLRETIEDLLTAIANHGGAHLNEMVRIILR